MLTENQAKAEVLGILSYLKRDDKGERYKLLPYKEWKESRIICEAINKDPFDISKKKIEFDDSDIEESDKWSEAGENIKNIFSVLKDVRKNISVNKIYIMELPEGIEYVRFSGKVILAERKEYVEEDYMKVAKDCLSSIEENLHYIVKFNPIKESLLEKTDIITEYESVEKNLKDLTNICVLSAKFSVNKRAGSDNYIWNELLQNANDHIPDEAEEKILQIEINEKEKTLTLRYPDKGFSIRDFLAVSTNGNSGNILKLSEEREGRKGTGFKSVYNLFKCVEIESGPVKCTLEDRPTIIDLNDSEISVSYEDEVQWLDQEKWYYPIPRFEKLPKERKEQTCIKLYLRDDKEKSSIYEKICGEEEFRIETFENKKDFLFLHRINEIEFTILKESAQSSEKYSVNKKHILENYMLVERNLEIPEDILEHNKYWKKRKDEPSYDKKKKVSILFPLSDSKEIEDSEKPVYCTLPVKEFSLKLPFYINIPLLELKDDRTSLADKTDDNGDAEKWNLGILRKAFGETLKEIFKDLGCEVNKGDVNLDNLYKYFPYKYISPENEKVWGQPWNSIKDIPFIRTIKVKDGKEEIKACSFNEWVTQADIDNKEVDKFIFLPDYMYWWFGKKKRLDGFESDIRFVYYGDDYVEQGDWKGTVLTIFEQIEAFNKEAKNVAISYKREKEGYVGEILLTIADYIDNKSKEDNRAEWFAEWLKKLWDSKYFDFENRRFRLFKAFLVWKYRIHQGKKYHCIGNRELKNDFHEMIEIEGYINICSYTEEIMNVFGISNFNPQDIVSIKKCFEQVLESPYISYGKWENSDGKEEIVLSLKIDDIKVISDMDSDRIRKQILLEGTKELFGYSWDESDKEGIKSWIDDERDILYWEKNNTIIPITQNTFYTTKLIEHDNVIYVSDEFKELRKYINSLDEAITNAEFYQQSQFVFIQEIIKKYEAKDWKKGVRSFLENFETVTNSDDEEKDKIGFLLQNYVKNMDSYEPLKWRKEYGEYLKYLSLNDLYDKNRNKIIFKFANEDKLRPIDQFTKDEFDMRVSSEEKYEKRNFFGGEIALKDMVESYIHLLECKVGNKALYCWGITESNQKVFILFSESAFETMLSKIYDCNEYFKKERYKKMDCVPLDELVGFTEEEITDKNEKDVKKIAEELTLKWKDSERKEKKQAEEDLISILVRGWDISTSYDYDGKVPRTLMCKGYGAQKYMEKRCPICKSILLAEKKALRIGRIPYRIEDKNYHLPMLMCQNCHTSLKYVEESYLEQEGKRLILSEETLRLRDTRNKSINLVLKMHARETKKISVEVTFLNRWLWYCLTHSTDKENEN